MLPVLPITNTNYQLEIGNIGIGNILNRNYFVANGKTIAPLAK